MFYKTNTMWYADEMTRALKAGKDIKNIKVDLTLSNLKPKHAQWISTVYEKLKANRSVMMRGWELLGLKRRREVVAIEDEKKDDD